METVRMLMVPLITFALIIAVAAGMVAVSYGLGSKTLVQETVAAHQSAVAIGDPFYGAPTARP